MEKNENSLKEVCKKSQNKFNFFLDTEKYILVHIDGRSFSKLIKNKFSKPFDKNFISFMNETAKYLCEKIEGVQFAYVQSDEITLVIKKNRPESCIFFNGRMCKLISIISSIATSKFNQLITNYEIIKSKEIKGDDAEYVVTQLISSLPLYEFDCKVWNENDANGIIRWLLFRNIDCVRNSKQQSAQSYFSHKQLEKLTADEQINLLKEKYNIDWENYEEGEKYGRYVVKKPFEIKILNNESTSEEDKYNTVIRTKWDIIDGFNLTNPENRNKLLELCPCLNKENNN